MARACFPRRAVPECGDERDGAVPRGPGPPASPSGDGTRRRPRSSPGRTSGTASTGPSTGSTSSPGAAPRRARHRRGGRRLLLVQLRRDGGPFRPGRGVARGSRRGPRRPRDAHARQPGRAVGLHPGSDEARRGHHADDHRGRPGRPHRPRRPRRGPLRRHHPRADRASSPTCPASYVRICTGPAAGWADLSEAYLHDVPPAEHPGTGARRPAAPLLHLRDHLAAQARRAHPGVVPGRPPLDDVLARPPAGRRPPQHLEPRLGQARLVVRLRPVDRRGDGLHPQLQPLRRGPAPRRPARARGHDVLRAPDRVADADQRRPLRRPGVAARGRRRR